MAKACLDWSIKFVALLRGGAWIEMSMHKTAALLAAVALLRGGAWIEISTPAIIC